MEKQAINFAKARDFGDSLSDTFKFLKQEFKPLIRVLLTYVGPFLLITGFLSALYQTQALEGIVDKAGRDPLAGYRSMASWQYFLSMIGAIVSSTLLILAVFSYIKLYKEKGSGGFELEEVWRMMGKKFLPVLGATLLIGLIFGLGAGVVAALFTVSVGLGILLFLGFLVFALYIGISISLFIASYVFEDVTISESINRSRHLVKDYWWYTFGLAIVIGIVAALGQYVFLAPQLILTMIITFTSVSGGDAFEGSSIILTIFTVFGTFGSYLLYAIPHTTMALHFHSQVEKKESPNLINKIDQINQPDETDQSGLGF
jgi:MFS family permease